MRKVVFMGNERIVSPAHGDATKKMNAKKIYVQKCPGGLEAICPVIRELVEP
jgi:hypothetical protein